MSRYRNFLAFPWGASHAVNDIYWYVLPSILPAILNQFGLSYSVAGGILTLYLGVIAFLSWTFGRLSDRISRTYLIGGGFMVASFGFLFSGFAGSLYSFIVLIILAALGVSTYHPAAYAVVGDDSSQDNPGARYGFFEFWGALGIFLMFLFYGPLVEWVSWNGVLWVTGLPGLILGYYFLKNAKLVKTVAATSEKQTSSITEKKHGSLWKYFLFYGGISLRILALTAIVNFTPLFLVEERGLPLWLANWSTGFIFLGGMGGTLIFGGLSDRIEPRKLLLWLSLSTAPLIFILSRVESFPLIWLVLVVLGGCWLGFFPPQNRMLSLIGGKGGTGQVFGLMMAFITIANAFAPLIFGWSADFWGLEEAVAFFSLPALAGFLLLLFFFQVYPSSFLLADN